MWQLERQSSKTKSRPSPSGKILVMSSFIVAGEPLAGVADATVAVGVAVKDGVPDSQVGATDRVVMDRGCSIVLVTVFVDVTVGGTEVVGVGVGVSVKDVRMNPLANNTMATPIRFFKVPPSRRFCQVNLFHATHSADQIRLFFAPALPS